MVVSHACSCDRTNEIGAFLGRGRFGRWGAELVGVSLRLKQRFLRDVAVWNGVAADGRYCEKNNRRFFSLFVNFDSVSFSQF